MQYNYCIYIYNTVIWNGNCESQYILLSSEMLKVIHSVGQGHGFGGNVFSLVHLDDLRPN